MGNCSFWAQVKEANEEMVKLLKQLQQATQEADEARSSWLASEELQKFQEEAEEEKVGPRTMESTLFAA